MPIGTLPHQEVGGEEDFSGFSQHKSQSDDELLSVAMIRGPYIALK